MALPPRRLPTLADGLLPPPPLPPHGCVAYPPRGAADGRTPASRARSQPSAAIIDAQSVKTVEESAPLSGYDGPKRVKGRKRHILVDTLGLPISISVTPADTHDTVGAWRLLAGLKPLVPRLAKI